VAFSPDGRTLASGSTDATIQLWDLAVPARPAALGHLLETPHQVSSVAFSPNGRILAASGNDGGNFYGEGSGTIQLWDVADRARPTALGRSGVLAEGYSAVAFSPHGRMLPSGSMHSVVQLWDVADPSRPTVLCSLRTSAIYGYTFVAFRPDGRILAGGNGEGVISLWNVANPARPVVLGQPLAITGENPVSSLAFSPDGRTLIGSSNRGFSNLGPWDGPGGIYSWDVSDPARPKGPTPFATVPVPGFSAAAFSPDGRTLASGGDGGSNGNGPGTVQLWDVANPARPTALGRPLS
jgi:WD40 repeat protein